MSRQDDLRRLIAEHHRHLQILKQQEAEYGSLNVPTHIITQIQDREAAIETLHAELVTLEAPEEASPQPKLASSPVIAVPVTPSVTDPHTPRIFLCHASEDKPRVIELYRQLQDAGYRPWLDKIDLLPGQNWRREIEKIIRDPYSLILVCLSNNSVTKRGVVQQELKWALDILDQMPEDTIYLIPIRLEECESPERLSELHWVDLFEPDGFEYLKRALDYEFGKRQPLVEPMPIISTEVTKSTQPKPTNQPSVSARDHIINPAKPEPTKSVKKQQVFEPELILIPAGEFLMGSDPKKDELADEDEQPQHTQFLPNYYIAKTPVTNAQYAAFVQVTGYQTRAEKSDFSSKVWKDGEFKEVRGANWQHPTGPESDISQKGDHPVVHISWHDAVAYSNWLAQVTGKGYRLPTEAEWEKAARGTEGRIYPWGNEWDAKRCNTLEGSKGDTTPVGAYPEGASPYGLLDTVGNVLEWTRSLWGKDLVKPDFKYPYKINDWREKLTTSDEIVRVLRGASFGYNRLNARCACRDRGFPVMRGYFVGFRVVVCPSQWLEFWMLNPSTLFRTVLWQHDPGAP